MKKIPLESRKRPQLLLTFNFSMLAVLVVLAAASVLDLMGRKGKLGSKNPWVSDEPEPALLLLLLTVVNRASK